MRRARRFRSQARALARLRRVALAVSRVALLAAIACVLGLVTVAFARVLAQNVRVARQLVASQAAIETLRARELTQRRTIVRLSDPRGAVPEIHDKLHVVGAHEEIIYVRGLAPAPGPGDWRPQP